MDLIFPFKNIATNTFLEFTSERENISDFILTEKDIYPYTPNYFLAKVESFKNDLPNFENEILQITNTSNQETIDAYFQELIENYDYTKEEIDIKEIITKVSKWNSENLKAYNEKIERLSTDYFKNDDRKRKHLEEYETYEHRSLLSMSIEARMEPRKMVKKMNYNFYCVEEVPNLIDESFCEKYEVFVSSLANEYFDIAIKYINPYLDGEIKSKYTKSTYFKPAVFVEGEYDITYIQKAAERLNNTDILQKIELRQRGGYSNLDKLWDIYKDNNWETIPQKKLLLYDCDVNKTNEGTGIIFKRVIELIPGNIITKGIENLFPDNLIRKAMKHKKAFVDITKVERLKRGEFMKTVKYEVNSDEKKNLCNWICENANEADFVNFSKVFSLIKIVLENDDNEKNSH